MPRPVGTPKRTTTQKGLGWRHQQAAAALHRAHHDGTPCGECGHPMYRDPPRNWDYDPAGGTNSGKLHADHGDTSRAEALRRGIPIPLPNRLLHGICNMRRGAGVILANATNGGSDGLQPRAMDWPI